MTNGVSLVYHKEKVYFLHLDDNDQLAMQVITKKDKDQGYTFKRLTKVGQEESTFEEGKHKALVNFVERPRIVLRKTSIQYPENEPKSDIGDFDSESLKLESIAGDKDHRILVDIRSKLRHVAEENPKLELKVESQKKTFQELMELSKTLMEEEYNIPSQYGSPQGRELQYLNMVFDKDDLEMAKGHSNERYYLTKQAINTLKDKY